jgi:hypothetical protein
VPLRRRPYRHVLDLGAAVLRSIDHLDVPEEPAVGPGDEQATEVDVRVELSGRVLRELEQLAELGSRAGVLLDVDVTAGVAVPAFGHEDNAEAVGVLDRHAVPGPMRVGRRDRIDVQPPDDIRDTLRVAQVQHEQRLRIRCGRAVRTTRRELEVRAGARDIEERAVVAVVVAEPADLGQPEAVAVERDELGQPVGVPSDAQIHR